MAPAAAVAREPRQVARGAHQMRGLFVIGMCVVVIGRHDERGAMTADALHHGFRLRAVVAIEAAVRQAQILPLGAQLRRRVARLDRALLHGAAARHLAARQIHDHHPMAVRSQQRGEPAARQLHVVRMSAEEQRIGRHAHSSSR